MRAARALFALTSSGIALTLVVVVACQPLVSATPSPLPTTRPETASVEGMVVSPNGSPLAGATVRTQATTNATVTDNEGRFILHGLEKGKTVAISAWKNGYYCAKVENVTPPSNGITLNMRLVQTNDNPNYQWIPPTGENSCYSCKPGITQVWLDNDAHGKSATNFRFLTMYNGTDVNGNRSPLTRYADNRDYGRIPLRPELAQPYFGPGYKLDFPDTAGNCAACHIPGTAVDSPYEIDPNTVGGVNTFGVHCDYCHKIAAVRLSQATGLPVPNMPGVLSQDFRRPFPEDKDRYQIFFGSFDDDNVPMEDTYLPLVKQSQFCAPCHFGVFWDTLIYNSFGEWLDSPYSNPASGKTCQQCHMPVPTILNGQPITNVAPGKGGVERDPLTIPAHTFPGASSVELMQSAVTLSVSTRRNGQQIIVEATICNDKTGHHVPTDSPLRQMILLVEATSVDGAKLAQKDGSTIPDWGGVGDPARGYYAGLPGKGFAKILSELWTEISPTGAYWNPTRIVSDNRIPAFGRDTSFYSFVAPADGKSTIQVTLLFRRAFKELIDQKGWDAPDIVMGQKTIYIP